MRYAVPVTQTIGIIGAGAWGTALGLATARAGRDVVLWGRDSAAMSDMAVRRRNARHLPDIDLPAQITPTADPAALAGLDVVLLVVPAQLAEDIVVNLSPHLAGLRLLLLCCKGIAAERGAFLSQIMGEQLAHVRMGALSGPSFAADVARSLPTAVTLAIEDESWGEALSQALGSPSFRPYWTSDLRGVEIGGALKNVYAIASGIVAGRGLGDSARAALIARAFAEMCRFGLPFGGRSETLSGLSGLGDLVLTTMSEQSRNLRFGLALGRGEAVEAIRARLGTVEGIATAGAISALASRHEIDMPIASAVAAILAGTLSVEAAIDGLMRRPLRAET
ncbi:MAG: NAD(P)-dependent glycerol-3-phosphate dehydrogenase [Hyphomicrobiales bacterium]|nr:NAD(P)-dependent glycerol-3-phosphate dehydrogenase [Hyphomicrobiales bacterium]OQW82454.1 MAG: glycerol-3-phosphate dehydrogenase [Proteobacteria bacterium ST_bin15]